MLPPVRRIEEVLRQHEPELLQKANVTSAGLGEENADRFIIVFVRRKLPKEQLQADDVIPQELDGYRVEVREELTIG